MSVIRIREESPTVSISFNAGGTKERTVGKIGHAVQGGIDWKKTAETIKATGTGLEIELIEK